jgi:hypothetical protein
MFNQPITLQLEIPAEVAQQDVWNLEDQISHVDAITAELREPKDIVAATLLLIHVVGPYLGEAVAIAGGIKAARELAQIIYDFLHPKKQETDHRQGKNKVVIITHGKRIELYNLTPQEIESVLKQ